MLRNIKSLIAAILLVAGTSSCLDKLPESSIREDEAMQTFDDAEQILTGIYEGLMSSRSSAGPLPSCPTFRPIWLTPSKTFRTSTAPHGSETSSRPIRMSNRSMPLSTASSAAATSSWSASARSSSRRPITKTSMPWTPTPARSTPSAHSATQNSSSASARHTTPQRPKTNSASSCVRSTPRPNP